MSSEARQRGSRAGGVHRSARDAPAFRARGSRQARKGRPARRRGSRCGRRCPRPATARWSRSASAIVWEPRAGSLQASHRGLDVRRLGEEVRAEGGEARMERHGAAVEELDDRRIEADGHVRPGLEDGDRGVTASSPRLPGSVAVPGALHPQVGVQRQPAVEIDEQVLALASHRADPAAHDPRQLGSARARRRQPRPRRRPALAPGRPPSGGGCRPQAPARRPAPGPGRPAGRSQDEAAISPPEAQRLEARPVGR